MSARPMQSGWPPGARRRRRRLRQWPQENGRRTRPPASEALGPGRELAFETTRSTLRPHKGEPKGAVLERPQVPARHRLDVGAYYRMAEAGILSHPQRVGLIDGDIFDRNPIGSPHAAVTRRLGQRFARAVADGLVLVSVQNPLRLDAYNEPQPDFVALARRPDAYAASHPGPADCATGLNIRREISLFPVEQGTLIP